MDDNIEKFVSAFHESVSAGTFVKLTLGNYRGREEHLQRVAVRPIETKNGVKLQFQYRYDKRDEVKNHDAEESSAQLSEALGLGFRSGNLFTTASDLELTIGKKSSRLSARAATFKETAPMSHDRKKGRLLDPGSRYLHDLGITTQTGEVRAQQHDKWRQINKYVEILGSLFDKSPLADRRDLRVVDMGSGKGYLTFAAYDYFANSRGLDVKMTGVDVREDLVGLCNKIAESAGFQGLRFQTGTIESFKLDRTDILIALHACDTATDDALYKGIAAEAEIIVAAPCCHKEVRGQIVPPESLKAVLKHGTLLEQTAETITDGLRSLLLEENCYRTKVFEFVSAEHTPKNNMIAATRRPDCTPGQAKSNGPAKDLLEAFGIREQRLYKLLSSPEGPAASDGT